MSDENIIERAAIEMAQAETYGWVFERGGLHSEEKIILQRLYRKRSAICFNVFKELLPQESVDAG